MKSAPAISPMEQFQHIVSRLKTMFDNAGSGQRTMAIGLPVVLAIGLFAAFQSNSPHWVPLNGVTRDSMATTQKQLQAAGLTGFQIQNGRILVPGTDLDRYQQVLEKNNRSTKSEWEQQFSKTGLFTTREQLQAAREIALEKTIRRAIMAVPAIDDVSVTWARSQQRRWGSQPTTVTATVCVTPNPQHRITPQLSRSLQTAVANMIPDLRSENVTVFDQSTGQSTGNFGTANEIEVARRSMEDNYRQRLQSALGFLPNATVTVAATGEFLGHQTRQHDRQTRNPVVAANATTANGSTRAHGTELHVSIYVADPIYRALGKLSGEKTRREIESVVRRIVEPGQILASLHVGSQANIVADKTLKSPSDALDQTTPAWVTPVICLVVLGLPLWWSHRLNTRARQLPLENSDIVESDDDIADGFVIDADVDSAADAQSVAELDAVLASHPNESLAVLQKWTQTSEQSAAAVASRMEPTIAAQFANRMSDDERNRLHDALQTTPPDSSTFESHAIHAIPSFCRQVADTAQQPTPTTIRHTSDSSSVREPQHVEPNIDLEPEQPGSRIFEFPPRLVAQLLENEQPQTVAIALAQLDSKSINKILRNFSTNRSAQIRERLLTVDAVPSGLRNEIEDVVLQQLLKSNTTENP